MMIRVLQVFQMMGNGGVENLVMNLYRKIDRNCIQFDFLTSVDSDGYFDDEIRALGGRVFHAYPLKKNPIKNFKDIKRIVKENNYSIVHRHTGSAFGYYELRAARKGGAKTLVLHSHNPVAENMLIHRIFKACFSIDCVAMACSKESGEFLFGRDKNVIIFKNPIDCDKYKFNQELRNNVREELGLHNEFVIGHIGRFGEQKNHKRLVDIFYQVKKMRPNSKLICIGDGYLRKPTEEKVISLGLEKDVIFTGNIDNVEEIIQAFDVFCFPSLYEGFSITQIEAQVNGLKCYTSKEKVPDDSNITGNVTFIPLSSSDKEWAKIILNSNNNRDLQAVDKVRQEGFDLNDRVAELTKMYTQWHEEGAYKLSE